MKQLRQLASEPLYVLSFTVWLIAKLFEWAHPKLFAVALRVEGRTPDEVQDALKIYMEKIDEH